MSDPVIASLPIPRASLEQFAGPIAYAGDVAANLFVSGGRACILRMGHHKRGQDEQGQLVEAWAPGVDVEADEVFLQAICDCPPDGGHKDINPFVLNIWPLSTGAQPTTIGDAMGKKLMALPLYVASPNHFVLPFTSGQAFYLLRKMVSNVFATAMARGAAQVEFILSRGEPRVETVTGQKVIKVRKLVEEKKRDKSGNLIFSEASAPDGQPIYDPVCDRNGVPQMDPRTGEVRKLRRLIYDTEQVERDVEQIVPTSEEVSRVPIYLQVTNIPEIGLIGSRFSDAHAYETHYDPTWMLIDVLAGHCKDRELSGDEMEV
jgi:hypothetical protein